MFVSIPVCWQLYYERRDRFLACTLPRISKSRYLGTKWCACVVSAFFILFIPYFLSALSALYAREPQQLWPVAEGYTHVLLDLYEQATVLYALLFSLWKGLLGMLTMTFGFVLALYGSNIFVILTGPFIYVILENFSWSILGLPRFRFVTAFEPSSMSALVLNAGSYITGPLLMCFVMGLMTLYFTKVRKRSVYPV